MDNLYLWNEEYIEMNAEVTEEEIEVSLSLS